MSTSTENSAAKYLIVSANGQGGHQIIFVTDNLTEMLERWMSFDGSGAAYVRMDWYNHLKNR